MSGNTSPIPMGQFDSHYLNWALQVAESCQNQFVHENSSFDDKEKIRRLVFQYFFALRSAFVEESSIDDIRVVATSFPRMVIVLDSLEEFDLSGIMSLIHHIKNSIRSTQGLREDPVFESCLL